MPNTARDSIAEFLIANIPKRIVLSIEEALIVGAQRAYAAARGMDKGHLANALGQDRHFHMNEGFHRALAANGANPTPLKGNSLVTGTAGSITLGRLNTSIGVWNRGRSSVMRRELCEQNKHIAQFLQGDLFRVGTAPTACTIFFVACFARGPGCVLESPESIHVAVPEMEMKEWLFREPLSMFLARYDHGTQVQADRVTPKLKAAVQQRDKMLGSGDE
ncbi:hypothetical protein T35B1_17411 [Salinisphaera shabanensis T35B1]